MKTLKIHIDKTRAKGIPAVWEEGGGMTNTGRATVWATPKGKPPRALYVRRRGHLANADHALIAVSPGMWRIHAGHHRGDFSISVYRVKEIEREGEDFSAVIELVYEFDRGEWIPEEPPKFLLPAIEAARKKAQDYHCRRPYYIADDGAG